MAYSISGVAYYAAYERHRVPMQDWSSILHKPRLTYSILTLIQSTVISDSSLSTLLKKIQNVACIPFESTAPLMSVKVIIPVYFHCQESPLLDVEAVSDGSTLGVQGGMLLQPEYANVLSAPYVYSNAVHFSIVLLDFHLSSTHPRNVAGLLQVVTGTPSKDIYLAIAQSQTGIQALLSNEVLLDVQLVSYHLCSSGLLHTGNNKLSRGTDLVVAQLYTDIHAVLQSET
ncbi:hypothetical protein Aperf_G00000084978 [Anoplocephala perfoliata]